MGWKHHSYQDDRDDVANGGGDGFVDDEGDGSDEDLLFDSWEVVYLTYNVTQMLNKC